MLPFRFGHSVYFDVILSDCNFSGFQLNVSEEKQVGSVFLGAGALKEKKAYSLTKLTSRQREKLEDARKYAREQGIKAALLKQTITHQQQVIF